MNKVLSVATKMAVSYAIWGVVTICDPVLISEEAAKNCKVLEIAKDVTDLMVVGCKLSFVCPIITVQSILKKLGS